MALAARQAEARRQVRRCVRRWRVLRGLWTILAGAVFGWAGHRLERACIVDDGPDETQDEDDQPTA